ncbi:DUF3375 family protein [Dyella sp. M7H15-1]|nr:DUF3375 family protein [Dyella sp. M7H15-1]
MASCSRSHPHPNPSPSGRGAIKLGAADHAPEIIGLLQTLLMDGERKLSASILFERLQHQLDAINASDLPRELPRTAQAYYDP